MVRTIAKNLENVQYHNDALAFHRRITIMLILILRLESIEIHFVNHWPFAT